MRHCGLGALEHRRDVSLSGKRARLALEVEKVEKVWRGSKAKEPGSLAGKTLVVHINPKHPRMAEQFLKTLAELEKEDRARAGIKRLEDNHFAAVELLQKVE